jgi:hypothetical protein
MSDEHTKKTISLAELPFDKMPLFRRNGRDCKGGHAVRLLSDVTIVIHDQKTISAKAGNVLFKTHDGAGMALLSEKEFEAQFSRVLKNGHAVKLSKPHAIQLAEIREADDEAHFRDWVFITSKKTVDNALGHMLGMHAKVVTSDIFLDIGMLALGFNGAANELVEDVKEDVMTVLEQPSLQKLGKRLKRALSLQ